MVILKEFKPYAKGFELNAVETEDLLNFFGFGDSGGKIGRIRGNLCNDNGSPITTKNSINWESHRIFMGWGFNLKIDNKDVRQGFANCKFFLTKVNPSLAYLKIECEDSYLDIDLNASFDSAKNFLLSRK